MTNDKEKGKPIDPGKPTYPEPLEGGGNGPPPPPSPPPPQPPAPIE